MAPDSSDVTRLLAEAARATNLADQQYFTAEADKARSAIAAEASAGSGIDLARAVVQDTLTPVLVHEHHTASTDWLGDVDTSGADAQTAIRQMTAEASIWFGSKSDEVKADGVEFEQQAFGAARKLAGQYGPNADAAERAFLDAVGRLHYQASAHTAFNNGESVGETWHQPAEGLSNGLPGERTTSERSPAMQDLEANTAGGSVSDTSWPDPMQLPQQDVDAANGGGSRGPASASHYQASAHVASNNERNTMPQYTAACPECSGCQACGGLHRVAVSGLDQIQQTVDPHDNGPAPTAMPTEPAFPWQMPEDSSQAIGETEQQLKQREQLKGASRRGGSRQQQAVAAARVAAERAYTNAMRAIAGQDDSGWLGDMGAGGVRPGMQDGGNPGTTYPGNLQDPDPVYGFGGDNGNQPLTPYGHDEANDYTNNPGMNYQPGQDTHADLAGRGQQVGGGQATAGLRLDDPEVLKALRYAQARSAHLSGR